MNRKAAGNAITIPVGKRVEAVCDVVVDYSSSPMIDAVQLPPGDAEHIKTHSNLTVTSGLMLMKCVFICFGGVAQLGERLLCKQNVAGSIPVTSTIN